MRGAEKGRRGGGGELAAVRRGRPRAGSRRPPSRRSDAPAPPSACPPAAGRRRTAGGRARREAAGEGWVRRCVAPAPGGSGKRASARGVQGSGETRARRASQTRAAMQSHLALAVDLAIRAVRALAQQRLDLRAQRGGERQGEQWPRDEVTGRERFFAAERGARALPRQNPSARLH